MRELHALLLQQADKSVDGPGIWDQPEQAGRACRRAAEVVPPVALRR